MKYLFKLSKRSTFCDTLRKVDSPNIHLVNGGKKTLVTLHYGCNSYDILDAWLDLTQSIL